MFYGAGTSVFKKAKELRLSMTEGEKVLWAFLNKNRLIGLKFRPQHPIDKFIADFYCHSIKLVMEVDGGIHKVEENQNYDNERTIQLEEFGILVLRYTNEQVLNDFDRVKKEIINTCLLRMAQQKVPFRGFRGTKRDIEP